MASRWLAAAWLLLFGPRSGECQSLLSHTAQCLAGGLNFPCASAQWGEGGPQALHVEGRAVALSLDDSCTEPADNTGTLHKTESTVAVVLRGGCSFGAKALSAQRRGFAALVIVDYASAKTAVPPGLGPDAPEVTIPVAMAVASPWSTSLLAGRCASCEEIDATCANLLLTIALEAPPREADIWQQSPWYRPNATLSADPRSRRFSIVCDPLKAAEVSDDPWLLRAWLSELGARGCHEIGGLQPQISLDTRSVDGPILATLLAVMSESRHGLVRLPRNDAVAEPMRDLGILHNGDTQPLLQGLNSNSHRFSWGGRNTYPRRFQSGVLVLKDACIRKDGIAVTVRVESPATVDSEFHYGGCGCCPLGHGELGRTFDPLHEEVARWASGKKVVSLVQRFHHVFYHFLLEGLPRLLQVLDLVLADREWQVLVDLSGGPFVRDYVVDVLGLWEAQILPYERGVSICAELLLVPAPLPCGHAPRALILALRQTLLNHTLPALADPLLLPLPLPSALPVMTVLRRPGARAVRNHAALVAGLRATFDGTYAVVELETEAMRTDAQVAAFRRTTVLVAPHGSGLSNAIHLPPNSTVVELLPWEYPNLTFYVALAWLPLNHAAFLVPDANAYSSMNVDMPALVAAVARYLGNSMAMAVDRPADKSLLAAV